MNRAWSILLAAGAAAALLAGTAWMAARQPRCPRGDEAAAHRDLTDMTGRRVRIPVRPGRILSLCTSATDTLLGLGAADRLVAIDEFSRVVPGTEHVAVVGKGSAVSREQVLALGIDLAFVWWYQDDTAAMLADLEVAVVRIRSGRARELPGAIRLIGDCVDCRGTAGRLAKEIHAFLAATSPPPLDAPRVFLELYGPLKTAGRDTYTNDLLELAGARNVAADAQGSVVFSAERLVQADPDVVLYLGEMSDKTALTARPGMAQLRAVREGRVRPLERYWLVGGPHLPESVARIRKAIHAHSNP